MLSFVDELELASNAYRTKEYIVTQRIMFRNNKADGSMIISIDAFYKRTKERDDNILKMGEYEVCIPKSRILV